MTGKQYCLVDTHVHLNDPKFAEDLEAVQTRALEAGITTLICVGYDLTSSRHAVNLAQEHSNVFAVVGIHPHDAKTVNPRLWEGLLILAKSNRVVAIGEIGFDFYRNLSSPEVQREAFRRQLQLALDLGLPVVIHDRDAHAETLAVLKEYPNLTGVVLHCFSGDLKMAEECLSLGFHLGIGGPLTYPKNDGLREIFKLAPLDKILLETDCPYLTPQPWRGKRNEPSYLGAVAATLAEIRGITLKEVAETTTANARRFFRLNDIQPK